MKWLFLAVLACCAFTVFDSVRRNKRVRDLESSYKEMPKTEITIHWLSGYNSALEAAMKCTNANQMNQFMSNALEKYLQ